MPSASTLSPATRRRSAKRSPGRSRRSHRSSLSCCPLLCGWTPWAATCSSVLTAMALSCYTLVLLIAQVVAPRFATGVAGAVLLGLFLLNSLSRTFDSLATLRWLSPFRYYELSQPLAPGGEFDLRAALVLFGIAIVAGVLATLAFAQRDLGSALLALRTSTRPPTYEPSPSSIWLVPVVRGLSDRRVGLTMC